MIFKLRYDHRARNEAPPRLFDVDPSAPLIFSFLNRYSPYSASTCERQWLSIAATVDRSRNSGFGFPRQRAIGATDAPRRPSFRQIVRPNQRLLLATDSRGRDGCVLKDAGIINNEKRNAYDATELSAQRVAPINVRLVLCCTLSCSQPYRLPVDRFTSLLISLFLLPYRCRPLLPNFCYGR